MPPMQQTLICLIMEWGKSLWILYFSVHWSQNSANFCSQILQENSSSRFCLELPLNLELRHKSIDAELMTEWQPIFYSFSPTLPPYCWRKPHASDSSWFFMQTHSLWLFLPICQICPSMSTTQRTQIRLKISHLIRKGFSPPASQFLALESCDSHRQLQNASDLRTTPISYWGAQI